MDLRRFKSMLMVTVIAFGAVLPQPFCFSEDSVERNRTLTNQILARNALGQQSIAASC